MSDQRVQFLEELKGIAQDCGLANEFEAADYVLLHYNMYPEGSEFLKFCESYLKGEQFYGF